MAASRRQEPPGPRGRSTRNGGQTTLPRWTATQTATIGAARNPAAPHAAHLPRGGLPRDPAAPHPPGSAAPRAPGARRRAPPAATGRPDGGPMTTKRPGGARAQGSRARIAARPDARALRTDRGHAAPRAAPVARRTVDLSDPATDPPPRRAEGAPRRAGRGAAVTPPDGQRTAGRLRRVARDGRAARVSGATAAPAAHAKATGPGRRDDRPGRAARRGQATVARATSALAHRSGATVRHTVSVPDAAGRRLIARRPVGHATARPLSEVARVVHGPGRRRTASLVRARGMADRGVATVGVPMHGNAPASTR
jgi:hypothetical protein